MEMQHAMIAMSLMQKQILELQTHAGVDAYSQEDDEKTMNIYFIPEQDASIRI